MATTIEYNGHTIELTEDFRFKIVGGLTADDYCQYESAASAREEIDRRLKAVEAQERRKLSIPMLRYDGKPVTVTGVHGRNYNLLGVGDRDPALYPPNPWIAELLEERETLRNRIQAISEIIGPFEVRSGGVRVMSHEEAVRYFERAIAEKIKAAEANRPPQHGG